jgi:hypothetical protein
MKVRIRLFPLLENLMEGIGGTKPEIILKNNNSSFHVLGYLLS